MKSIIFALSLITIGSSNSFATSMTNMTSSDNECYSIECTTKRYYKKEFYTTTEEVKRDFSEFVEHYQYNRKSGAGCLVSSHWEHSLSQSREGKGKYSSFGDSLFDNNGYIVNKCGTNKKYGQYKKHGELIRYIESVFITHCGWRYVAYDITTCIIIPHTKAVPEPETIVLFGVGLLIIAKVLKRGHDRSTE